MDHQTAVEDSPRAASITADLVTIAELQLRLFEADLRRLWRGAMWALIAWAVAGGLFIAVVPVALAGAGLLLADSLGQSPAAGLLWVALAACGLIAILVFAGWRQLRMQAGCLQRSRQELHENLKLLKNAASILRNPFKGFA
jgi:putative superfamily III holin-X